MLRNYSAFFIVLVAAICVLLRPSMDRASQSHYLGCSEYMMYSTSRHPSISSFIPHSYHNELQYPISCTIAVYFHFHHCFVGYAITLAKRLYYFQGAPESINISALQLSFTIPTADCCISYRRRLIVASSSIHLVSPPKVDCCIDTSSIATEG